MTPMLCHFCYDCTSQLQKYSSGYHVTISDVAVLQRCQQVHEVRGQVACQGLQGRAACCSPCQAYHQGPHCCNVLLLLHSHIFPPPSHPLQNMHYPNCPCSDMSWLVRHKLSFWVGWSSWTAALKVYTRSKNAATAVLDTRLMHGSKT